MRFGKEGGLVAALLRNQLIFCRVTRQEGIFEHNPDRPLLHAFFMCYALIDNWLKSSIIFKGDVLLTSGSYQ